MIIRLNIKSLVVGLLVGLVAVCLFGAASSRNEGVYQLSMTADNDYVIYGRIHTGTGKVETWKYLINNQVTVPHLGDKKDILLGIDAEK
jgi:hypothetical protein